MGSYSQGGRHGAQLSARLEGAAGKQGFLPVPLLVQWMATLRCPLSCQHCLATTDAAGFDDMPLPRVLDLIDQAAEMGVGEFLVTGGEPLAREDLPEVIAKLARRRLSWSLNTACMPGADMRRAIELYPPELAAVSLDGPQEVHDAFRGRTGAFIGAMESLAWFAGLKKVQVVAGTTVTRINFPHLSETFRLAVASGANAWGIHLLVPEGRARAATDRGAGRRTGWKNLALERRQLGNLMRFVAAKRRYFPVTMADEFGYCGDWEPLLRDTPFHCGAGVAQCVVLPDGSVVPCTTLDRATSAGNLHERPLAEIWRDGFAELRNWQPAARCAACRYAPACGGGCWLQRRHGLKCHRDVWHVPQALETAAGIMLCLGMTAAAGVADSSQHLAKPSVKNDVNKPEKAQKEGSDPLSTECGTGIEADILRWYGVGIAPEGRQRGLSKVPPPAAMTNDPAYAFLNAMENGQLPTELERLAEHVAEALKTSQRSLAFSALLWRATAEWSMKNDPAKRTDGDRKLLRDILAAIEKATAAWRAEIFEKKLEPYLARGRTPVFHRFEMTKAVLPTPPWLELIRDTEAERWGGPAECADVKVTRDPEPLEGWLDRHPYAEAMILGVEVESRSGIHKVNAAGRIKLKITDTLSVFDVLTTGDREVILTVCPKMGKAVFVTLPPRLELSYVDLLELAYSQNTTKLDRVAAELFEKTFKPYQPVGEINPLLMPAVMKLKADADRNAAADGDPVNPRWSDPAQTRRIQIRYWLADFWMF